MSQYASAAGSFRQVQLLPSQIELPSEKPFCQRTACCRLQHYHAVPHAAFKSRAHTHRASRRPILSARQRLSASPSSSHSAARRVVAQRWEQLFPTLPSRRSQPTPLPLWTPQSPLQPPCRRRRAGVRTARE
eukprot:4826387-Pleurochrysis_carterae.AAC.3